MKYAKAHSKSIECGTAKAWLGFTSLHKFSQALSALNREFCAMEGIKMNCGLILILFIFSIGLSHAEETLGQLEKLHEDSTSTAGGKIMSERQFLLFGGMRHSCGSVFPLDRLLQKL